MGQFRIAIQTQTSPDNGAFLQVPQNRPRQYKKSGLGLGSARHLRRKRKSDFISICLDQLEDFGFGHLFIFGQLSRDFRFFAILHF